MNIFIHLISKAALKPYKYTQDSADVNSLPRVWLLYMYLTAMWATRFEVICIIINKEHLFMAILTLYTMLSIHPIVLV